ncbi:MAG: hydroxyisourate hydrolase [Pseudomonadota bacterium]|jgi:5-hydroxyisourate hydrolase
MSKLSTHVLDTFHGCPAAGVNIVFSVWENGGWRLLKQLMTNADGRSDAPLLAGDEVKVGKYRLVFCIGDYYRGKKLALAEPLFLDEVPIEFAINQAGGSYHVPLVCSPWSYSTYRGS